MDHMEIVIIAKSPDEENVIAHMISFRMDNITGHDICGDKHSGMRPAVTCTWFAGNHVLDVPSSHARHTVVYISR